VSSSRVFPKPDHHGKKKLGSQNWARSPCRDSYATIHPQPISKDPGAALARTESPIQSLRAIENPCGAPARKPRPRKNRPQQMRVTTPRAKAPAVKIVSAQAKTTRPRPPYTGNTIFFFDDALHRLDQLVLAIVSLVPKGDLGPVVVPRRVQTCRPTDFRPRDPRHSTAGMGVRPEAWRASRTHPLIEKNIQGISCFASKIASLRPHGPHCILKPLPPHQSRKTP